MTSPKIYTKKGDDGTTRLFSGKRVNKHNIRIKTCGTLDELNVWIGMIRNFEIDKNTLNTLSNNSARTDVNSYSIIWS